MQTYIAFNACGHFGYVLEEAVRTFKRKNDAVALALSIQKAGSPKESQAVLDKAMRTIQSANRTLKAKGWFLLNKPTVDQYVAAGRAIIKG